MDFIITYWIEFLFGILISVVAYILKKIVDYKKTLSSTTKGVKVLLKSKIIEHYNLYMARGKVTIHEKQLINDLYDEYKKLGGNGIIESLKQDIDDLSLYSRED